MTHPCVSAAEPTAAKPSPLRSHGIRSSTLEKCSDNRNNRADTKPSREQARPGAFLATNKRQSGLSDRLPVGVTLAGERRNRGSRANAPPGPEAHPARGARGGRALP